MKKILKKIGSITLLFTSIIIIGACQNNEHSPLLTPSSTDGNKSDVIKSSDVTLKEIIGNDAGSEQKQTAEESVINQIQWRLSNGKIIPASKESMVWSIEFGKNSLAVLEIPETTHPWYNFIFQTYKDGKWNFSGYIDLPINKDLFSQKQGLELPMNEFAVANLATAGSEKNNVWAFANESKYVVIGKYPKEELLPLTGSEEVMLSDNRASWFKQEGGKSVMFYLDTNSIIWVTGNLSKEEMKNLGNSIPSVNSPNFPTK